MTKKQKNKNIEPEEVLENQTVEASEQVETVEETATEVVDENELLLNELEATREELEKQKKEYLFLMAEFDNYRKRVLKEKADLMKNAAERTLLELLPIVDDFERGLAAAESSDAAAILEGMSIIYNKLIKYLESNGVKAMDSTGAQFDADLHEAIAIVPAPAEDLKGKVLDTVQKGYMINDKVLRYAKVAVGE